MESEIHAIDAIAATIDAAPRARACRDEEDVVAVDEYARRGPMLKQTATDIKERADAGVSVPLAEAEDVLAECVTYLKKQDERARRMELCGDEVPAPLSAKDDAHDAYCRAVFELSGTAIGRLAARHDSVRVLVSWIERREHSAILLAALANFANDDPSKKRLLDCGASDEWLVPLLRSSDERARLHACRLVYSIATDWDTKARVANNENTMRAIFACVSDATRPRVVEFAVGAMANIAMHPDAKPAVATAAPALLTLVRTCHPAHEQLARCLFSISAGAEHRADLVGRGVVPALAYMMSMSPENDRTWVSCVGCFCNLAQTESEVSDNADFALGVVRRLNIMFSKLNEDVARAATRALVAFKNNARVRLVACTEDALRNVFGCVTALSDERVVDNACVALASLLGTSRARALGAVALDARLDDFLWAVVIHYRANPRVALGALGSLDALLALSPRELDAQRVNDLVDWASSDAIGERARGVAMRILARLAETPQHRARVLTETRAAQTALRALFGNEEDAHARAAAARIVRALFPGLPDKSGFLDSSVPFGLGPDAESKRLVADAAKWFNAGAFVPATDGRAPLSVMNACIEWGAEPRAAYDFDVSVYRSFLEARFPKVARELFASNGAALPSFVTHDAYALFMELLHTPCEVDDARLKCSGAPTLALSGVYILYESLFKKRVFLVGPDAETLIRLTAEEIEARRGDFERILRASWTSGALALHAKRSSVFVLADPTADDERLFEQEDKRDAEFFRTAMAQFVAPLSDENKYVLRFHRTFLESRVATTTDQIRTNVAVSDARFSREAAAALAHWVVFGFTPAMQSAVENDAAMLWEIVHLAKIFGARGLQHNCERLFMDAIDSDFESHVTLLWEARDLPYVSAMMCARFKSEDFFDENVGDLDRAMQHRPLDLQVMRRTLSRVVDAVSD